MGSHSPTAARILEAGRQLFNAKGYAATSLSDIAKSVGISKGNLSYHFPTKRDLALQLITETRRIAQERRLSLKPSNIADDYVEHLLFAMDMTWNNRFLLRDRQEFAVELGGPDSELTADFDELRTLIQRIDSAGMFRKDAVSDLSVLTRSIWIVSRYWMDYLREFEGQDQASWADQELGIRQHFAVLLPCLTASAKRAFTAALDRAPQRLAQAAEQQAATRATH